MWWLNNMQLNNGLTKSSRKKSKDNLETSENENTMTPNLWDTAKALKRGKFIATEAYLKKQEKSQSTLPPK